MSTPILIKKSSVTGKVPLASDLVYGELAINYTDGKLYFKDSANQVKAFSQAPTLQDITNAGSTTTSSVTIANLTVTGTLTAAGLSGGPSVDDVIALSIALG